MDNDVDLIIGPMFSGKTSELMRKLMIYSEMGRKVLYINSKIDTRGSKMFSTHNDTLKESNKITFIKLDNLADGLEEIIKYDVVGIDEAQFFPDLVDSVKIIAEYMEKYVIVAGLDSDFNREPFENIIKLIPFVDKLIKLNSYCKLCNETKILKPALFNHKVIKGVEHSQIQVGGSETYIPLCRKCYVKNNNHNLASK